MPSILWAVFVAKCLFKKLGKEYFDPYLDTICDTIPDQEFKKRDSKKYDSGENFLPPFTIADRLRRIL